MLISIDRAIDLIFGTKGQIFGVTFIRRTPPHELRKMAARLGVTAHLRGGSKGYDASEHLLITVFDLHKRGYRSIPVEGLVQIRVSGETYEVIQEKRGRTHKE